MKQIVLILLFVFAMQKGIDTNPLKEQNHTKKSFYIISATQLCEPGYEKSCNPIKMFLTHISPKRCFCYDKKTKSALKEIINKYLKITKDKEKLKKERVIEENPILYIPLRGKLELVKKDDPHCGKGKYLVCYEYPALKMSKCHCSLHPY